MSRAVPPLSEDGAWAWGEWAAGLPRFGGGSSCVPSWCPTPWRIEGLGRGSKIHPVGHGSRFKIGQALVSHLSVAAFFLFLENRTKMKSVGREEDQWVLNPCICRMGRLEGQAREMLSTGMPVSGTGFRRYFGSQPCRGGVSGGGAWGCPGVPQWHCPPVCRGLQSGLSGSLRPPGWCFSQACPALL